MKKKMILSSMAVAGVLSTGAFGMKKMDSSKGMIHCKGVSTKWVNDCGANGHDCAGYATKNFDSEEWLRMSAADCKTVQDAVKNPVIKSYIERIQKGTVVATKRGKKF